MLRPYQYDLVSQVRDALQQYRSVLLQLETGAGKTIIGATLAVEFAKNGRQSLFLVHREELIDQAVKTLSKLGLGEHVGVIASGHSITPWAPLQIGMIQTVSKRLEKLEWLNPALIVYDEAHHVRASTWERVAKYYHESYALGLTATPARLDGKGLGDCFKHLIEGPPPDALTQMGVLADFDILSVDVGLDLSKVKVTGGDYNRKQADEQVKGPVIAAGVSSVLKYAKDRRLIHYAHSVRHSKLFAERLTEAGIQCEHVDGSMPAHQRRAILARYRDGITQAISNVELVNEGFDVPECDCVVMGRRTASLVFWRQCAGRQRRPKGDGRKGLFIDLAENLHLHGPPDVQMDWSLQGGVSIESVSKAKASYSICANCGFINPSGTHECRLCGHLKDVVLPTEVEVDLVKFDSTRKGKGRRIRREMNERVMESGGDRKVLEEIQRDYGQPSSIVDRWVKVWGPVWRHNRAMKSYDSQ